MMADNNTDWLGKIRGHVSEANARFKQDAEERKAAEKAPNSIILTEDQIRNRDWDAASTLMTTLGGKVRPITPQDLAAFQHNMRLVTQQWQRQYGKKPTGGITARQVINIASGRPLGYADATAYKSDLDKAKREITSAIPVSARSDQNGCYVRFLTNAGKDSKVSRHTVVVQLMDYQNAVSSVMATSGKDKKTPMQAANKMRKGLLKFDCDCERHRYFFRYLATIGDFAAGRQERGFPKIRNPNLRGVACKHVLRVMAELESSNSALNFLTKFLEKTKDRQAKLTIKQQDAEKMVQNKTPTRIRTSAERAEAARKERERKAARRAATKPVPKPQKKAVATRKPDINAEEAAKVLAAQFGLTVEQVLAMLKNAQGGK